MAFTPLVLEGFETGGLERFASAAGTVATSSTVRPDAHGVYSCSLSESGAAVTDIYEFQGLENSNAKAFGGWFNFSTFAVNNNLITVKDSADGTKLNLYATNTGAIVLRDKDSATVTSFTDTGIESGWHFLEIWYEDGSASADWEVFLDGTSLGSGTGADFRATNSDYFRVFGASTNVVLIDDYYFAECTTAADCPHGMDIFATTGDGSATTGGDTLDAGSWPNVQEIPANDSNLASYNAPTPSDTDERLGPDTIAVQTNLTGSVTDIDDDPDSPDGNWLDATGKSTLRTTFPSPGGDPKTGADLQEFRVLLRKSATGPAGSNERHEPDVLTTQTGLSGSVSDIQDDPDNPTDGTWLTTSASNCVLLAQFPTPTGNPSTGAGLQQFKLWVRKDASGGGTPLLTVEVHDADGLHATLVTDTSITSDTGQLLSYTWDASGLNTSDGATVAIRCVGTKGGGGPNERNVEFGAIEWNAQVAGTEETPGYEIKLYENGTEISGAGSATGTLTDAGGDTVVSFTWDAAELGVTGGGNVECYVNQTDSSPTRYIDIGAVEWNCKYPTEPPLREGWIQADSGALSGPSGIANLNEIVGLTTYIRTQYSGSGSNREHTVYRGNSVDGTTGYILGWATAALANYFNLTESATVVPLITEYTRVGFGHSVGVDVDIDCTEVVGMVAHVPFPIARLEAGSFALTGEDADLDLTRRADLAAGSFALAGEDADLVRGYHLAAEASWIRTFYLDGSDGGWIDGGSWSNESNALDGSIATSSHTLQDGSISAALRLLGSSAPDAGGTITNARWRYHSASIDASTQNVVLYIGALDDTIQEPAQASQWSDWGQLTPSAEITWANLTTAEAKIWASDGGGGQAGMSITRVEIEVTSGNQFTVIGQDADLTYNELQTELDALAGSFALAGQDAELDLTRRVDLDAGAFALTGEDAEISWTRNLPAAAGSFDLAGADADLAALRALSAGSGAFTLTGEDLEALRSLVSRLNEGTLTLVFPDLDLLTGYSLEAESGSYALAGEPAELDRTILAGLEAGSFTLAGELVDLDLTRRAALDPGAFALTGSDADLDVAGGLAAESGSFALAGQDVELLRSLQAEAETGSYTITPAQVDLELLRHLSAEAGVFTLTGEDLATVLSRYIAAESGSYNLVGEDAGLEADGSVALVPGSFALSGADADLERGLILHLDAQSYALTGYAADLEIGYQVHLDAGAFALTGEDATLTSVGSYDLAAESGSFQTQGQAAELIRALELEAAAGSYALTGSDAGLQAGESLAAEAGSFALTGQDAELLRSFEMDAEAGSYATTGTQAALELLGQLKAETGQFQLQGPPADLDLTRQVDLETGSFNLAGQDVAFQISGDLAADPGAYTLQGRAASLILAGLDPAEESNRNQVVIADGPHQLTICDQGREIRVQDQVHTTEI